MSEKPIITTTQHILPYDHLSPLDFERLCLGLVVREGYENAEHLGAAGSEQGRDLRAWKNGQQIIFQCKRVRQFGPADAKKEIQKLLDLPLSEHPAKCIFLVTRDISIKTRNAAEELGKTGNIKCEFWGLSELDEKVNSYPELVERFFGSGSELSEKEHLTQAVSGLLKAYDKPGLTREDMHHRPFKHLLPLDYRDRGRFFGRVEIQAQLLSMVTCADSSCQLAILHGDTGIGKTSLLTAGMTPALLEQNYLPIHVEIQNGDIAHQIKNSILPNLAITPEFQKSSLQAFLGAVQDIAQPRTLIVILDQFERFFAQNEDVQQDFHDAISSCLKATTLDVRWLISLRSAWLGHLQSNTIGIPARYQQNQTALPPLSREQARIVLEQTSAISGVQLDPDLVEKLMNELGPRTILPGQLQIVANTLYQNRASASSHLTPADLESLGSTPAILKNHLNLALENLDPARQKLTWRVLATLASAVDSGLEKEELARDLALYGFSLDEIGETLKSLSLQLLIRRSGQRYQLSSNILVPSINEWLARQSIQQEVQAEFKRQLRRILSSTALRGALTGGIGFSLAFLLTNLTQIELSGDWAYYLFIFSLMEGPGGLFAGGMLVMSDEIRREVYHGASSVFHYILVAIAGSIGFGFAMMYHELLEWSTNTSKLTILFAGLEGALWGAVAGLGLVYVRTGRGPKFLKLLFAGIGSGFALWIGEFFAHAYHAPSAQSGTDLNMSLVFLAGVVMPALIMTAAVWGDSTRKAQETQS